MSLLEVHNISIDVVDMNHHVIFGQRRKLRILKNISMQVERGETLGIVGESGSGKTSLGRTLLRLYEPSEGQIIYDGRDISHLSHVQLKPLRRHMQMIFQDPQSSLNPRKRIGEILAGAMKLHGIAAAEKDVDDILDRVGLSPATRARFPHQLSGGQRQRVGIARAIALKPDFVVADEIVSGLDTSTQAKVLGLLKGLRDEFGLALAFISHDLSVIRHICDRVIIMKSGEIIEAGETAETFRAPKSSFTKLMIDAIPLPEPNPQWLDVEPQQVVLGWSETTDRGF